MVALDPAPFRNRSDGSRWADDGGAPDLLPLAPRPEYEQDHAAYSHLLSLDPYPYLDTLSPSGRRYQEKEPQPRPPWSAIAFFPRPGRSQDEARYLAVTTEADAAHGACDGAHTVRDERTQND